MTSVFLWLCWMIVKEYMLGIGWMSAFDSSAFHAVHDDLWRWVKWAKKMDFDRLMGFEKLEILFKRLQIPCNSGLAKSLWLLWWCLFADQSCLIFWESQKVHFWLFCSLKIFNFCYWFLVGMKNAIFEIWSERLWVSHTCCYFCIQMFMSSNHHRRHQVPFFLTAME